MLVIACCTALLVVLCTYLLKHKDIKELLAKCSGNSDVAPAVESIPDDTELEAVAVAS